MAKASSFQKSLYTAMLGALAFVVMLLVSIPILPSAPFLRYEPSGVVILMATVLLGPGYGAMACIVKDLLYFLVGAGNIFGVTSDFINTCCFALVAGLVLRHANGLPTQLVGYVAGVLASVLLMIPVNLVVLQLEFGMTTETILGMMIPAILPFNLIKGVCNALVYHLLGRLVLRSLGKRKTKYAG